MKKIYWIYFSFFYIFKVAGSVILTSSPIRGSLVYKLVKNKNLSREELKDQIPHLIFPIFSSFINTVPRLLLLLSNHNKIFKNLILNLKNKDSNYLRKNILEVLRLNNPVNTTFTTVNQDTLFGNYKNSKGEQILILNNSILRNPNIFSILNEFIPVRWNSELEHSYDTISFNQGPQICPGKELTIFMISSFIKNLLKKK